MKIRDRFLTEKIPQNILNILEDAAQTATELNFPLYLAGGFVRDLLLPITQPVIDLDLVVEGDGIIFAEKLAAKLQTKVKTHKFFSTAAIILPEGLKIDVATARIEYYKHPAALPTVKPSILKNDLFRRDFTINALAIQLNGKEAYRLIDFANGQLDLKMKRIKILHPLSFVDDPTRIFRAIRFEQRLKFKISPPTLFLLQNAVKNNLINRLSGKRLFTELKLMLTEKEPIKNLRRLEELDILRFFHPRLTLNSEIYKQIEKIRKEEWFTY